MRYLLFLLVFTLSLSPSFSQTAVLQGVILNEQQKPVVGAEITYSDGGTSTNKNGFYRLQVLANQNVELKITYLGLKSIFFTVNLDENSTKELNFVMKIEVEQISQVVITNERETPIGVNTIKPSTIRKIPGANVGVENLLKTLPGVNSNNELSTQYSVRGGNYDENLIYVNGIQIYRPFLIRKGQQEGLSFINPDLVRKVAFSAGGFQAQYGDKMSSVLAIQYKRPTEFGVSLDLSLLGGRAAVKGISDNEKFSGIVGVRYRNNSLLVESKETQLNYKPVFADIQTYLTYRFNEDFELGFLGSISLNKYHYQPTYRETNFGTIAKPRQLAVYYQGQEKDRFETFFGALKASYDVSEHYTANFIASAYNTQEQVHYDILAAYRISENVSADLSSEDLGEAKYFHGAGMQLKHARNDLDALIINLAHRGTFTTNGHQFDYGIKFTHEDIRDRIREYEMVDSLGFFIRPPFQGYENEQPYKPYDAPIVPYFSIRAKNHTQIDRIQGYLQWSNRTMLGDYEFWYNIGFRAHNWTVMGDGIETTNHTTISPRVQFAIKPDWEEDMIFRLSGGFYHQPPFYQQLRDSTGTVHPEVKAQQAIHVVLGNEYSFELWGRPFTMITEAYYKDYSRVNPYTIENVQIRYRATNNAKAYAYGLNVRLNGEFVPGTESWVSIGYLKTEVNINGRGYIPRPTDQRLKFGVMYKDYVPAIPSLKLYLNLVYNTGWPGGSPNYADPYDYQMRLPNYFRTDLGISYVIVDQDKQYPKGHFLHSFDALSVGFEILNMFDYENSISNTYVRDAVSKIQYAIPNYLTPRVFNLRVSMDF